MIHPSTIEFLEKLKANNNKEWFNEHKEEYNSIKFGFTHFFDAVAHEVIDFDNLLTHVDGNMHVFRINRDVRFSKDKSPYKSNLGAFICPGGKKNLMRSACYYLHIEPGNSFVGGGAHMPDAETLMKIRDGIAENPDKINDVLNDKFIRKYYKGGFDEEGKLKTAPKGYPKDHPAIDLLKHKSFSIITKIDDETVLSEKFYDLCKESFAALSILNNYLNKLIAEN